jgi:uncharacterized protein
MSQKEFLFEWDDGNSSKSEDKHGISIEMIEEAFMDSSLLALGEQYEPVVNEGRYGVVAKSDELILFICFTIREGKIRPISARPANKNERGIYEEEIY